MAAIPAISDFTDAAVTEGEFKTALSGLHNYLTGQLGTAGTQTAAQAALGAILGAGVSTRTTAYTVVEADRGKIIACTGTFSLSLTAASTLGAGFAIAVANVGSGSITIDPNGTETIDAATTYVVPANTTALIACTGTAWVVVSGNPFAKVTGTPDNTKFIRGDLSWAVPAYPDTESMIYLGSVSANASQVTLSGLTLTSYKEVLIIPKNVSSNTTTYGIYVGPWSDTKIAAPPLSNVNQLYIGNIRIFLTEQVYVSTMAASTQSVGATSYSGSCNVYFGSVSLNQSSTSISLSNGAHSFDAGSFQFYGIK